MKKKMLEKIGWVALIALVVYIFVSVINVNDWLQIEYILSNKVAWLVAIFLAALGVFCFKASGLKEPSIEIVDIHMKVKDGETLTADDDVKGLVQNLAQKSADDLASMEEMNLGHAPAEVLKCKKKGCKGQLTTVLCGDLGSMSGNKRVYIFSCECGQNHYMCEHRHLRPDNGHVQIYCGTVPSKEELQKYEWIGNEFRLETHVG